DDDRRVSRNVPADVPGEQAAERVEAAADIRADLQGDRLALVELGRRLGLDRRRYCRREGSGKRDGDCEHPREHGRPPRKRPISLTSILAPSKRYQKTLRLALPCGPRQRGWRLQGSPFIPKKNDGGRSNHFT